MQSKEKFYLKNDFGSIVYNLYTPINSNGYIVQIAHGMIEEKSKYGALASLLCANGYVVAVNDHRGHGESIGGKSGEYEIKWGEMGKNGFERAVEDMYALSKELKMRFMGHKLILFGHSMGSLLSRRYLQRYENELSGLILMGSPSPNVFAGVGMDLCSILQFFGLYSLGEKIMNQITLIGFNSSFKKQDKTSPHYAWLTREVKKAEPYMQREDYNFSFTLNSFKGLFGGLRQVFSPYPNVKNMRLPIMFMSGDDDPCGEFGRGVYKAYRHLCSQGYHNVELRLYSGGRHELLLESNQEEIRQEILAWCNGVRRQRVI